MQFIGNHIYSISGATFIFLVLFVLKYLIRNQLNKNQHIIAKVFFEETYNVIHYGLGVLFFVYFMSLLLKKNSFFYFINYKELYSATFIIFLTIVIYKIIDAGEHILIFKLTKLDDSTYRVKKSQTHYKFILLFTKIVLLILSCAALFLNINKFKELGVSLLASAGIVTGIIALATKDIFSNFFNGVKLAFSDILKIGDQIEINNYTGTVEKINLTTIILRTADKKRYILPASYLLETPFFNDTLHKNELAGYVNVCLDYELKFDDFKKHITEYVTNSNLWDKKKLAIEVYDMTKNNIEIRIAISADNPANLWTLKCNLRESLVSYIQQKQQAAVPKLRLTALEQQNQTSHSC